MLADYQQANRDLSPTTARKLNSTNNLNKLRNGLSRGFQIGASFNHLVIPGTDYPVEPTQTSSPKKL